MKIKKIDETQIIKKSNYYTETYEKIKKCKFYFQNDKSKNLTNLIN